MKPELLIAHLAREGSKVIIFQQHVDEKGNEPTQGYNWISSSIPELRSQDQETLRTEVPAAI